VGRWHALELIRPETQHGLGRHILAVTPEMFERLLKVGSPSESNLNQALKTGPTGISLSRAQFYSGRAVDAAVAAVLVQTDLFPRRRVVSNDVLCAAVLRAEHQRPHFLRHSVPMHALPTRVGQVGRRTVHQCSTAISGAHRSHPGAGSLHRRGPDAPRPAPAYDGGH
jgi:hypothetical protein